MSEQSCIPVCEPLLAGRELEYVTKAVSQVRIKLLEDDAITVAS